MERRSDGGRDRPFEVDDEGPTNTSLVRKLGIKPGPGVAVVAAPPGFPALLVPLPEGVTLRGEATPDAEGGFDVILVFVREKSGLERRFAGLARCLAPAGGFWVCWPKKSSRGCH